MGTYMRMKFDALLRSTTPQEVVAILTNLVAGQQVDADRLPDHPLFKTERWDSMLRGSSEYWRQASGPAEVIGLADGRTRVSFHSSFKNYDNEADAFCSWIAPFLDSARGSVVGELETEDDKWNERPTTLLIAQEGRIDKLVEPRRADEVDAFVGYENKPARRG